MCPDMFRSRVRSLGSKLFPELPNSSHNVTSTNPFLQFLETNKLSETLAFKPTNPQHFRATLIMRFVTLSAMRNIHMPLKAVLMLLLFNHIRNAT